MTRRDTLDVLSIRFMRIHPDPPGFEGVPEVLRSMVQLDLKSSDNLGLGEVIVEANRSCDTEDSD